MTRAGARKCGFALGALIALVGPLRAHASEPAPVLREVRDARGPAAHVRAGSIVEVVGSDLHACERDGCWHDEVRVRLGGQVVMILESSGERLVVIVPQDLALGAHVLQVTALGRGTAELPLTVIGPDPDQPFCGIGPPAAEVPDIRVTRFEALSHGPARFEVVCDMGPLPEGFTATLELSLGERLLEQTDATITSAGAARAVRATFGPYERALPRGEYRARVSFRLGKQPRDQARAFRRQLPAGDAGRFDHVEASRSVVLGASDEAASERREARARRLRHYDALDQVLAKVQAHAPLGPVGFDRWCESIQAELVAVVEASRADDERTAFPELPPRTSPLRLANVVRTALHDLARRSGAVVPPTAPPLGDQRLAPEPDYRLAFDDLRRVLERSLGHERP